eukprot:TRINITY_DN15561_c0_g1_i1.p1 TRINITY_DN15561_c0_g1~~TRINITY_DN15561_c0_g1_i1.p1  ORF type:complete len:348 (+),score=86.99 TRINITY_DN15561_c0_g1_i1:211-1254(+)
MCVAGFCFCIPTFMEDKKSLWEVLCILFDSVTVSIPPILPAAMSVGTSMALKRLKEHEIYCVSPAKIAIAGKATVVCIDIHGTLLSETPVLVGYHLAGRGTALAGYCPASKISQYSALERSTDNSSMVDLVYGLATCNSLLLRKGEVIGTREEKELFESTEALLVESKDGCVWVEVGGRKARVVRRQVNRVKVASALVWHEDSKEYWLYAKGSLNELEFISKSHGILKESQDLIEGYESKCHQVLGVCSKQVQAEDIHKDWDTLLEDMDMAGVLVLKLVINDHAGQMVDELKCSGVPCMLFSRETPTVSVALAKKVGLIKPQEQVAVNKSLAAVSYTHLTLPTICSV